MLRRLLKDWHIEFSLPSCNSPPAAWMCTNGESDVCHKLEISEGQTSVFLGAFAVVLLKTGQERIVTTSDQQTLQLLELQNCSKNLTPHSDNTGNRN